MKLPTRPKGLVSIKVTSRGHESPPGVVQQPDNPFECRFAKRIWSRRAMNSGRYEVVIELDDGMSILGSFQRLPGFYDRAVPRAQSKRSLFAPLKAARAKPVE